MGPATGNGPTDLANLALICDDTHTRIHQGDIAVEIVGNHEALIWTTRDGTTTRTRPNRRPA